MFKAKIFILITSIIPPINSYSIGRVDINFVFATNNPSAIHFENKKQMLKEIEILNKYFVTEDNRKIFKFKFASFTHYDDFNKKCPNFVNYLKSNQQIKHDKVKGFHNQCFRNQGNHVYFYIYDAFSEKKGYKDATSWGFNNGSRPFILIDWERLNYNIQAAEPHEMGHAFGLKHICEVGAKLNSSTNIMASSACGKGSGGKRNIGFNIDQQKTIETYYYKLNKF